MLTEKQLDVILFKLTSVSSYNLNDYARKSIARRVERFLINNSTTPEKIVYDLGNKKDYPEYFVNEITVNTTDLFRDPKIWQFLRYNVLNQLTNRNRLNIWIAGCSTGQEVYSLLILLSELGLFNNSHVIATDINQEVIDTAKLGRYRYRANHDYLANFDTVIKKNPLNFTEIRDIPYEKYFRTDKARDEIIMNDKLRNKPIYIKHDLATEGVLDFTKFDLVMCRNVLIYFNQELQNKVLNTFHNNMFPNSYLLLGIHESILGPSVQYFTKKGFVYMNK